MSAEQALDLLNQMLWASLVVSAPLLLTILLVGLAVSVVQVTTQLQEITLSYVPKILVSALLLILIGPWMLGQLSAFTVSLYQHIPELVR